MRLVDALARYTTDARDTRASSVSPCIPIWHADAIDIFDVRTMATLSTFAVEFCFPSLMVPDLL